MLRLLKKHTDTLVEQTKIKPQETFEYKMNKQMETFSFNPPINLSDEGKNLLAVTFLKQPILFSIYSTIRIFFQLLHPVIGPLKWLKKVLTN